MNPTDTRHALEATSLFKNFPSGNRTIHALQGISLPLPRESFTAVMGPSGSGKTTFLNCVAGLEHPDSGTIEIDGEVVSSFSEDALARVRRRNIGFVFQGIHLIPYLTVQQNVELPLRLDGKRPSRTDTQALLAQVGLEEHSHRMPAELSGGQQQRVAVARAIAPSPAILLADEPTGSLDSRTAITILKLLRDAVDKMGQTVLMVTHDPRAASYADTAVFLVDGKIIDRTDHPTTENVSNFMTNLDQLVASKTEQKDIA